MAHSSFRRMVQFNRRQRQKFPKTLLKRVRSRTGRRLKSIVGYSYYPSGESRRQKLVNVPLKYKRHRILPIPYDQQEDDTCMCHAVINAMEARLRLARWKNDPRDDFPRLSVQHAIDLTRYYGNRDSVYDFLGVKYVEFLTGLANDDKGVTTEANRPFRVHVGPGQPQPLPLPIPSEVEHWDRFRLRGLERWWQERYDPRDEGCINTLIGSLLRDGPFIGWYKGRESHTPNRVLKREGKVLKDDEGEEMVHAVVICGYKKWVNRHTGHIEGYWLFMNSRGLGWGDRGFGRIAFNAIQGIEIPLV